MQVAGLPEYQAWMQGFQEGTLHLFAAAREGCPVLESSAQLQARTDLPLLLVLTQEPALAYPHFAVHEPGKMF